MPVVAGPVRCSGATKAGEIGTKYTQKRSMERFCHNGGTERVQHNTIDINKYTCYY
jgi:hypothetical protein